MTTAEIEELIRDWARRGRALQADGDDGWHLRGDGYLGCAADLASKAHRPDLIAELSLGDWE